ncbi:unnamed protein product, partial [Ectocarpus sp. 12 AP-2014]
CEYCRVTALYNRILFQQWWPGPSTAVRSKCKFILVRLQLSDPEQHLYCSFSYGGPHLSFDYEFMKAHLACIVCICILPSNASDLESRIFEAGVAAKQGRGRWSKSALFTIAITAVHQMPPDIATRQE